MNWWYKEPDQQQGYLGHFLWNCPQVNATKPHWFRQGLVPSSNKPLPEVILTWSYTAIWHHHELISIQYIIKSTISISNTFLLFHPPVKGFPINMIPSTLSSFKVACQITRLLPWCITLGGHCLFFKGRYWHEIYTAMKLKCFCV